MPALSLAQKKLFNNYQKMPILFLFNPGAMNFRHVMLNDLASKGLDVAIALPEKITEEWQTKCPAVRFIPFDAFSGTSIGILNNIKTLWAMRKLFKQEKPNAVFFGNVKPNIYGGLIARWLGIKRIYGLVSGLGYAFIDEPGLKRAFVKRVCMCLYRWSFKNFTHVFFQNKDDRDFFIQNRIVNENRSSIVNGTGVDLQAFAPKPFPEKLTFFMGARLVKEKGVFHFVEAAKKLKECYPDVRFVLAGNIDTNPSAITPGQLEECKHFVEYVGYCSDMKQAINSSSVFVYPSYYREGVPRALLEALACGRPVITTDSIGCRETVVDKENGFKITSRSTDSLTTAMENFIKNPTLLERMGHHSRRFAEQRFDIRAVNNAIYEVICQNMS